MLTIAHRGCAEQAPENTVAAIHRSAPYVDAVEIDITRCGSGELLLFHNGDLERVTGYCGQISDTSWSKIADLTVFDSGESIPRLKSAIKSWPEGTMLNLDIHSPGIASEALQMCSSLDEPILLSSTSPSVLKEVSGSSSVRLGYSFFRAPEANIKTAINYGCEYVHVPVELVFNSTVIEQAHTHDLLVDAWTVSQRSKLQRLADRGADAVTVNRWDIIDT